MTATALHGKDSVLLSDQYNLATYFKTFGPKHTKKAEESTVFGLTDRTYVPGLQTGTVSGGGLYKGNSGASDADAVLRAALGDHATGQVMTLGIGGFTIGKRCRLWQSRLTTYDLNQNNDGLVATSFESRANGGLDAGVSLHSHATAETSATNSASVDQAASSAYGAVAHLHVLTVGGTDTPTLTVKVQHSANNTDWADLITFTAATAVGSQRSVVAVGVTIDRYVRAISTMSGTDETFNYAVAFARRLNVDTASFGFEYYPQGGSAPKHGGEILPTSFNVDISNDGLVTYSAEYQGTGALTDTGTGSAVAGQHGKAAKILMDDNKGNSLTDVSNKGRTFSFKRARKEEDATVFGDSRNAFEQGLRTFSASYAGVWDPTIDEFIAGQLG